MTGGQYPLGYWYQVQWQMLATGLRVAYLAALVRDELLVYRIPRDDNAIAEMQIKAREFWNYVERREAPPLGVGGSPDLAWARAQWPEQTGLDDVDLSGDAEVAKLLSELHTAQELVRDMEGHVDGHKARLAQLIGNKRGLRCDGWRVSYTQNRASSKLDLDKLVEVCQPTPQQLDAATVERPGARVMRIKKEAEK
jgi:predicted phage-related endonuclease